MSLIPRTTIELLAASADDCVAAARLGADRVELNASIGAGGLTPSAGSLRAARSRAAVPIIAMLRPRPGAFLYSDADFDAMRRDAALLAQEGAAGFAFGFLSADGRIDEARCAALMAEAPGLEWVFHRAFDLVPEPFEALEALIGLGVRRLLTKGRANSFEEGEPLLLKLRERAAGRLEILVPGLRPHNIERVVGADSFRQLHLGRFVERLDPSASGNPALRFGSGAEGGGAAYQVLDEDYAREMIGKIRAAEPAAPRSGR